MRKSGILMPVTSIPSPYGIGCFSKEAYDFADFLKESGQSIWQILPLGHTGFGDSPYQSFSAFAGNPYMIDLCSLADEGLISYEECEPLTDSSCRVDYSKQYELRYPLLRKAHLKSKDKYKSDYIEFKESQKFWLNDYSLFMALKEHFGGRIWTKWPDDIKFGQSKEKYRKLLENEVDFWDFVQYRFFTDWKRLKNHINKNGIEVMGDIPIYVSQDSCDVWANPELFCLDASLNPMFVAGCPPDGFSAKGQLWGNPVYKWENHKKEGYKWWISRIRHSLTMYDSIRIDHFRGFESFYSIPAKSEDATVGTWEKGPGMELFDALKYALGNANIIAEDLGFITDSVRALLKQTGFAGIKVLEFAFDERDSGVAEDYLPYNYPVNSVAYTGTHDNEPISSWFKGIDKKSALSVRKYLCNFETCEDEIYKPLICEVLKSPADTAIIPIWDILGLHEEARINTPGTTQNNWTWRMNAKMLTSDVKNMLKEITEIYGRSKGAVK